MTTEERNKLHQLISEGKIQKALDSLIYIDLDKSRRKEALIISSRYKNLKRKGIRGILSFEHQNITENQIVANLIDLIDHPEGEHYPREKSINKTHPRKPIIWIFITSAAIIIGILGSLAEIIGLINVIPSPNDNLQLTVFVTDKKGNVVLEYEGKLNIPIGNRSLNEVIGAKGRTNFPDITYDNKGDTIVIGLEAEGWEIVDNRNTFVFTGDPIRLIVKKDDSLGIIKGAVKSRDGQEFIPFAEVRIGNDTIIYSDSFGIFNIVLPEKMRVKKETVGYLLTVSKEGYQTNTQHHYPKSSDAEIRLER